MSDVSVLAGGLTKSPANATSPIAGGNYPAGTPLTLNSAGLAVPAKANVASVFIGIPPVPTQGILPVDTIYAGSVSLPESDWQTVLGTSSGGLTPGAIYYVSDTTAGQITSTPPFTEGHFVIQVGIAESATSMFIQPGTAVPAPL
jgi:hypothetical protein